LLLFGSVTNPSYEPPLPPPAVPWQISSGPDLVTVPATVACLRRDFARQVVVNGPFFHVARLTFETRPVCPANFGRTHNLLALTRDSRLAKHVRENGSSLVIVDARPREAQSLA
jgi:hypothetical protein